MFAFFEIWLFCVGRTTNWEEALFTVASKLRQTPADEKAAVVGGMADTGMLSYQFCDFVVITIVFS